MAEKLPAKVVKDEAAASGTSGGGMHVAMIIGILVIAAVLFPAIRGFVFGLAPTLIALLMDRNPERYLTMCVGICNVLGMAPYMLLGITGAVSALGARETTVQIWLVAFGFACAGWVIHAVTPIIYAHLLLIQANRRLAELSRVQEQLVEQWGADVAKGEGQAKGVIRRSL
jgi:hypothetical protein